MNIPKKVRQMIGFVAREEAEKHRMILAKYKKIRLARKKDMEVLRLLAALRLVELFPYFDKKMGDVVNKVFLTRDGEDFLSRASRLK